MSLYPALKGKFGSTEYFLISMPVGDLVQRVRFPSDMPEWDEKSLEDRYQRKLQSKRIEKVLVPYFASDNNRFSGSLVMAVMANQVRFEPLSTITRGPATFPIPYQDPSNGMGFVTLVSESLVPLDGQHRAMAFKKAIEEAQGEAAHSGGLAQDMISVILVQFDEKKSRYIFNKINRYAKPTSKADKLITDDDDAVAVITRSLISENVFPAKIVRHIPNTLGKKATEFTTLATLYEANKRLIPALPIKSTCKPERLGEKEREARLADLKKEWGRLLSGIGPWKKATADPEDSGARTRIKLREQYVLGRPIGQLALINGYVRACENNRGVDRDRLVATLDRVDWKHGAKHWRGLLVTHNGKMMSGKPASRNAGLFIAYLIGTKLTPQEKENVRTFMYGHASGRNLPSPLPKID